MTTRKLLFIIGGIVASLILIGVIFVVGIVGFALYAVSHSEATETAKTFLRHNEKLKRDIGEVKDFGAFVTGGINANNADGEAALALKAIGARKTVNANISLTYRHNDKWQVTDATYVDDAGKTVELLEKYESDAPVQNDEQK